jgi:DNA-binding MarR family transcriptional regulator
VATTRAKHDPELARDVHLNVLIAAQKSADAMEKVCQTANLTRAQFSVLWVLCLSPNTKLGVPVSEIADGLVTRASDATRLVDRLENMGLAQRRPNPNDRRGVLVRPTAKGRQIFAALSPKLEQHHSVEWSNLDAHELGALNTLLAKALWGEALLP